MKDVYNDVFSKHAGYDKKYNYKLSLIERELLSFNKSINLLDIGCGKGHYLRFLRQIGFSNIMGIELSDYCSRNFLQDVPHINADFLEHCNTFSDNQFYLTLCMDVVEHISYEKIDFMLENMARISQHSLIGVANHSDMIDGVELHIIQENSAWWESKLLKYYKTVGLKFSTDDGKFFLFRCEK